MTTYANALVLGLVIAISAATPLSAHAEDLVLAVSEGTSGGLDAAQVIAKYKDLADAIGRGMKTKVNVVLVRDFATLEEGLKTSRYAFVMARPSDYPARGMRDSGYNYVRRVVPELGIWFNHFRRVRDVRYYADRVLNPREWQELAFAATIQILSDPALPTYQLIESWSQDV